MPRLLSRRAALLELSSVATVLVALPKLVVAQTKTPILVYKTPTCGCCKGWVDHMAANGFAPTVRDMADLSSIKTRYKIGAALQSCHTTTIGAYVVEGHVPASDVKRLLAEQPKGIVGLTIPGMPASAPGMDMKPFQAYTVLSFNDKGQTTVWAKHDKG